MARLLPLLCLLLCSCGDPAIVNLIDSDTVTMSLGSRQLCWRDQCWDAEGSGHTPTGEFTIKSARQDAIIGLALDFYEVASEDVPPSHPLYDSSDPHPVVWAIHKDNRDRPMISQGCLLVSEVDLIDIASKIQGARIVIGD